jgi:hypothetical protein
VKPAPGRERYFCSAMQKPIVAVSLLLIAACSVSRAPSAALADQTPSSPPVLVDDYFTRDRSAQLSESELREVLRSPVFLEENARVGVLPISPGFLPGAQLPRESIPAALATALEESGLVEFTTEIAPDWPTDHGLAGLRELAARYRCDYLLLYRHRFDDQRRANGWAALYVTLLPLFFVPGNSLETHGVLEASLFDVKTGTVLFTEAERVRGEDLATLPGTERTAELLQRSLLEKGVPKLAERVVVRLQRLVAVRDTLTGHPERAQRGSFTPSRSRGGL